jgi:glutamine synthetase
VGSSQSIAPANIALNVAVACALDDIATRIESDLSRGLSLNDAVHDLLADLFSEHLPIVFNGTGYAPEWQEEAVRRGLPNYKDTVSVLAHYSDSDVMEAFTRTGVLSERELLARQEILLENYIRAVHVETKLTSSMGRSVILPPAMLSLQKAAELAAASRAALDDREAAPETAFYRKMRARVLGLMDGLEALDQCHEQLDAMTGTLERAAAARDRLLPLMAECRKHADALETMIDDADWPLPKYNELLWQH